jgi:hypothetical protein
MVEQRCSFLERERGRKRGRKREERTMVTFEDKPFEDTLPVTTSSNQANLPVAHSAIKSSMD